MTIIKIAILLDLLAIWMTLPWLFSPLEAKVEHFCSPVGSRTANYFVAGMLNQPEAAFNFLINHSAFKDDAIIMVPYQNNGLGYLDICRAIECDIIKNGYTKVRFFGISLGTKVGRYFIAKHYEAKCQLRQNPRHTTPDGEIDFRKVDIGCYELNPCWTPDFVRPRLRTFLCIAVVPLTVVELLLGPLSLIPVIRQSGRWFSVKLTMSQLRRAVYAPPEFWLKLSDDHQYLSTAKGHNRFFLSVLKAVIVSDLDKILDNNMIEQRYGKGSPLTIVEARHADTIRGCLVYYEALDELLLVP